MRVRVLFFGILKEFGGRASDVIEMPDGATARDVLEHYRERVPQFAGMLSSLAVAVNQQYAGSETALKSDDEVALLPPVSGGSGEGAGETPAGQPAKAALREAEPKEGESKGRRRYASIVRTRIDSHGIVGELKRGEDGAVLVFEGIVRNQTRGRKTLFLDYEAYEDMALSQMEGLAAQALQQFQIREVVLVHRLGRIEIGETSVLIAVASAHRAAAFEACRWLIDTLKRTVPIWKKEYFEDGAVWADGETFPDDIPRVNS